MGGGLRLCACRTAISRGSEARMEARESRLTQQYRQHPVETRSYLHAKLEALAESSRNREQSWNLDENRVIIRR